MTAEFLRLSADLERPAHHIAAIAEREAADLIVVGSRGHSTLTQLIVGSVPLRLLHITPCPLLIVPRS
jgi:nucleotide-binding universal stress UspA family protein